MAEKGLLIIYTGNGKGKSSAAFGTALRTMGYGGRVAVVQFGKSPESSGEQLLFNRNVLPCELTALNLDGRWLNQRSDAENREEAMRGLALAEEYLKSDDISLLILDEVMIMLTLGHLKLSELLNALEARKAHISVIMTGRDAPQALIDRVDLVSEIKEVKHPFNSGIGARRGIDF